MTEAEKAVEELRAQVDPSIIHGTKRVSVRIAALRRLIQEYDEMKANNDRN